MNEKISFCISHVDALSGRGAASRAAPPPQGQFVAARLFTRIALNASQKTTPDQTRSILTAQPHVAYALITLMLNINAVDVDVLQRTVASFAMPTTAAAAATSAAALPAPIATAATTTTGIVPTHNTYLTPQIPNPYPPVPAPNSNALAGISEDQRVCSPISFSFPLINHLGKAMIMRVLAMTTDEINRLMPADRASIIQLASPFLQFASCAFV